MSEVCNRFRSSRPLEEAGTGYLQKLRHFCLVLTSMRPETQIARFWLQSATIAQSFPEPLVYDVVKPSSSGIENDPKV